MSNKALACVLFLVLLLALASARGANAGPDRVLLHGHQPSVAAGLPSKSRLPATNRLSLALGLPLRNQAALDELLGQIYNSQHPNFHKFLTPEEFTARFGPTEEDYHAVIKFAEANGLVVAGKHSNRLVLDVKGSVASVEQAFHLTLRKYKHPTEARDFFAPDTEPSVPASLPVADMWGLSDYGLPKPLSHKIDPLKITPLNFNGSGSVGAYQGADFRRAYVPGTTLTGNGQIAAVVEFDGYYASDITDYENAAGYGSVPLQNVLLDGVSGIPGYSGVAGAVGEVSLDVEMVIAMAPGLSKLMVYEGNSPYDVFNRIATDNLAKQVSCSWSWAVGPANNWGRRGIKTLDSQLQQMAAQGQSFFQAAGDTDAYTGGQALNSSTGPIPVDSIYVTSVGGTTLTMNGAGTSWAAETVWNWGNNTGSGGGISPNYPIPSWQTNVSMTANGGSTVNRNIPDVALAADAISVTHDNGVSDFFGGTSCAAPLWAGFCALINEQAVAAGSATVGFLNPALYALASGPSYGACFHDITTGDNIGANTPGLFKAVTNYDLCTGLGTPNGTNLINALAPFAAPHFMTQPASQAVAEGASFAFSANVGGESPMTYQWLFNGTNLTGGGGISGVNSNVLSITSTTVGNSGNYNLVAANSHGAVTSGVAVLTIVVDLAPTITSSSLTNQTVECGSNNVTFAVTASGTAPLSFQWSLDGAPVSGATNASFSPANVHLPNHSVTLAVTNLYGSVVSNAVLSVQDTLPPLLTLVGGNPIYLELGATFTDPGAIATDVCAGVVAVAAGGAINTSAVGTNLLVYTAADGDGSSTTTSRTVIVRDTTPPAMLWSFTNLVLATGTNCSALMPDVTGTNFILASDLSGALIVFQNPTNNTPLPLGTNTVVITVKDASGNAACSTNFVVVQDQTPPVILSQPKSQTNVTGTTATFTVTATACTPLAYQWFFSGASPLTNQTNAMLTINPVSPANSGDYSVVINSSGGASASAVATLTVNLISTSLALNSTANPLGYREGVNFTANVTPANVTGTMQFLTNGLVFDTETLTGGQAASTHLTTFPRGTNIITAIYSGDANNLPATNTLAQIITNHPPTAVPAFYNRVAGLPLDISLVELATNWTDIDGDAISLAGVGASTNGVILTNNVGTLVYLNSNNVPDHFTCTITDGWGGTNLQTVNIAITMPVNAMPDIRGAASNPNGSFTLSLGGAPGLAYVLETTSAIFSGNWLPVATNTLGASGVWEFNDAQASNFQQRFYRLELAP